MIIPWQFSHLELHSGTSSTHAIFSCITTLDCRSFICVNRTNYVRVTDGLRTCILPLQVSQNYSTRYFSH